MNISLAYFMYFQSDATHPTAPVPEFGLPAATESRRRLPHAYLDPAGTYRIVGERGTVRLLTMSMGRAAMGLPIGPVASFSTSTIDDLHSDRTAKSTCCCPRATGGPQGVGWTIPPSGLPAPAHAVLRLGVERDPRLRSNAWIAGHPSRMERPRSTGAARSARRLSKRLSAMWLHYQKCRVAERACSTRSSWWISAARSASQWYWQGLFELRAR